MTSEKREHEVVMRETWDKADDAFDSFMSRLRKLKDSAESVARDSRMREKKAGNSPDI